MTARLLGETVHWSESGPKNGPFDYTIGRLHIMAGPQSAVAFRAALRPHLIAKALITRFALGSFEFRLALDALPRPAYGYGVYHAAQLAERLAIPRIAVLEFGVAGGNGLVELERVAAEVERGCPTRVSVFGFDTGMGLPEHSDYRDLPYIWRKGHYLMDVDGLKRRLRRAELVLGDVATTVPQFLSRPDTPPIGFVSFDLDYYSSTAAAFRIFDGADDRYLPRVLSYFDDIVGSDSQLHCEDVGELLAIAEFNRSTRPHRIRPIHGLGSKRLLNSAWAPQMFAYHRFDHPRYGDYIGRRAAG
jgi:hypothetical protein